MFSPLAGKNRRLKQAKEEAQAEIEQYRLQREKEFKTKEAAVSGSNITTHTSTDKAHHGTTHISGCKTSCHWIHN